MVQVVVAGAGMMVVAPLRTGSTGLGALSADLQASMGHVRPHCLLSFTV